MTRRQFVFAAPLVAAGCGGRGPDPAAVAREQHLAGLARFRVPPTATLTTPPPPADVLVAVPELRGLVKVAVRLHPRFSDEPGPAATKLGGRFVWPAVEPWPACAEHRTPCTPVLQVRAADAPPHWPFPPGADLFQLFWCPRDHADSKGWVRPTVVWRQEAEAAAGRQAEPPPADPGAVPGYVPVPCRLFPERLAELPPFAVLPAVVREKVEAWKPDPAKLPPGCDPWGPAVYALASAASGTKAGGYPHWLAAPDPPACPRCRWGMDYLLTAAGREWDAANAARWKPAEERDRADDDGFRSAAGLAFGGGAGSVHLFACGRCPDRPVRVVGRG